MGIKNNKTCIICRENYSYCHSCRADANKPSWYAIFDGQNCFDIYEVCTAYRDGKIDIGEAYNRVSELDVSKLDNFVESTKNQIKEILNYKNTEEVVEVNEEINDSKVVKKATRKKSNTNKEK